MLEYIQTIGVPVNDQERALDFYVNTLGLVKQSDEVMSPDERWIAVKPSGRPAGGFTGYIFYTADIDKTCSELEAKGVKITVPAHAEPWGKWAQFADPD